MRILPKHHVTSKLRQQRFKQQVIFSSQYQFLEVIPIVHCDNNSKQTPQKAFIMKSFSLILVLCLGILAKNSFSSAALAAEVEDNGQREQTIIHNPVVITSSPNKNLPDIIESVNVLSTKDEHIPSRHLERRFGDDIVREAGKEDDDYGCPDIEREWICRRVTGCIWNDRNNECKEVRRSDDDFKRFRYDRFDCEDIDREGRCDRTRNCYWSNRRDKCVGEDSFDRIRRFETMEDYDCEDIERKEICNRLRNDCIWSNRSDRCVERRRGGYSRSSWNYN